jgi:hypothetical protein
LSARSPAGGLHVAAVAVLLAGPAALAFASGGYFDVARLVAALVACVVVAIAASVVRDPLPRGPGGRIALAGLAALFVLTLASMAWAPLRGPAYHDAQRLLLYLATLVAAGALLRPRLFARAVEPALAAGTVIVTGYGLAGRLLPGIVEQSTSASAGGRLDQPLTYWNASGSLAAIGFVLCARLAGDTTRPRAMRLAAAAAAAPLGTGIYLSFSRGALAAVLAGLIALIALAPRRRQLWAIMVAVGAGALAAAASALFPGVESLHGSLGAREAEGVAMLAILVVVGGGAALVHLRLIVRERADDEIALIRRIPAFGALGVLAVIAVLVAATALSEQGAGSGSPKFGAGAGRLTSVTSHRYEYWKVAIRTFGDHPLAGDGSGSFPVEWLQRRPFQESVRDAHSLYLETAAELGVLGLIALAALIAGVVIAGRRAGSVDRILVAGPAAGAVTWATHSAVDWMWEMPAVTLPALVLVGALLAAERA